MISSGGFAITEVSSKQAKQVNNLKQALKRLLTSCSPGRESGEPGEVNDERVLLLVSAAAPKPYQICLKAYMRHAGNSLAFHVVIQLIYLCPEPRVTPSSRTNDDRPFNRGSDR